MVTPDNHPKMPPKEYFDDNHIPKEILSDLRIRKVPKKDEKFTLDSLKKFIVDMVRGNDGTSYEAMYPIINELYVFSISSVAYKTDKQVDWKMGRKDGAYILPKPEGAEEVINTTMFDGRAIHEFIQKRFVEKSEHWRTEIEVRLHIPYNWKNIDSREILLIGHCDLINVVSGEIMELKSSHRSDSITHYHELQAGTYSRIITDKIRKILNKPDFPLLNICVIKIGGDAGVRTKALTEEEINNAYSDMVQRCERCAKKLDEQYAMVKEKLGITGFVKRADILRYAEIRAKELDGVVIDTYNASRAKTLQELDLVEAEHTPDEITEVDIQLVSSA